MIVFCYLFVTCQKQLYRLFLSVSNKSKPLQEEVTMKHSFYDVKAKKKVEAEVIEKVTYGKKGNERYAFKAKSHKHPFLIHF